MTLDTVRAEVVRLLRAGKKIEAIKLLRSQGALGLKEAKEFANRLEHTVSHEPSAHTTSHQMPVHIDQPLRSNAEQKPASNVAFLLLLVFLAALAAYFYMNM